MDPPSSVRLTRIYRAAVFTDNLEFDSRRTADEFSIRCRSGVEVMDPGLNRQ